MKPLILSLLIILGYTGFGQSTIKISALPKNGNAADSALVPATINGVTVGVYGKDLARNRIDSLANQIALRLRYSDTVTLSNRILLKLDKSDSTLANRITSQAGYISTLASTVGTNSSNITSLIADTATLIGRFYPITGGTLNPGGFVGFPQLTNSPAAIVNVIQEFQDSAGRRTLRYPNGFMRSFQSNITANRQLYWPDVSDTLADRSWVRSISSGGGAVASVSNANGTLTVSPTTGAVVASLNLANNNTWTGTHLFEPTSTASSGLAILTGFYPTINQTSTAGFTGVRIAPYIQTQGSGATNLLEVGTENAANGSGTFSGKLTLDQFGNLIVGNNVTGGTLLTMGSAVLGGGAIGTTSAFTVNSTTKGSIPFPSMTTTQKNAISSPAEGLMSYDNVLHAPYFYNGTAWTAFGGGGTPSGTTGQIQFNSGGSFGANNANFWDNTGKRLILGMYNGYFLSPYKTRIEILGDSTNATYNDPFLYALGSNRSAGMSMGIVDRGEFIGFDASFSGSATVWKTINGSNTQAIIYKDQAGYLRFFVDNNGLTGGTYTPSDRMSISNNGEILINAPSNDGVNKLQVNGGVKLMGGQTIAGTAVSDAAYTMLATDYLIRFTALTATRAITPPASPATMQHWEIKNETANTSAITFVGTLDGAVNPTLINTAYGSKHIYYNGSSWFSE